MRFDQPTRAVADYRAEKDLKLKSIILGALAAGSADQSLSLVARSAESPIATALVAALRETTTPHAVRVILLDVEPIVDDAQPTILDMPSAEVRHLKDARFSSAHEQISVGGDYVWIGDCMRRDPAKRDAFEMLIARGDINIANATQSFRKLWAVAKALPKAPRRLHPIDVIAAGQATDTTPANLPRR